ncbi:HPP family protein [Synechococcus sp. CBW1004]|jgi:CBS-domain-containing membrane protein|uniref:HPP family protein n=1 Tax=Synechococcus sp. CBW1004 TaxID=1353136 RepID=UPI0018CE13C8|nr:HPP family protein [Synechococcus sp. CBW1004]QPN63041.1 HPP family protein [Synechococcus sp. CBW1004]
MVRRWLQEQRRLGRAYQPRFQRRHLSVTWLGALLSLALLGLLSTWSGMALLTAPLGASSVLLFGYPASPLAQPRNLVLGNLVGGLVSVLAVAWLGRGPLVIALAVALTILLGQQLRCLHPPAGGLAFLGVALGARPSFLLTPVLNGSLLLVLLAAGFSRWVKGAQPYPVHWL